MFVYVDDIIVFSADKSQHSVHVTIVLDRLTKWNLPVRADKSRFGQKKVRLLGFVVSGEGVRMDPKKVESIRSWQKPRTVKQLQRFLGAANFYRQFIPNFSTISHPLDAVRSGKGSLKWTDEMEESFKKLKELMSAHTMLAYPNDSKDFIIGTDASDYGLGAWIGQCYDEKIKVLSYASRSLSISERKYAPTKKELLAVIYALKKFNSYISGKKFVLRTDHRALVYIFTQKHLNRMLLEWFDHLMTYDFKIEHVLGSTNTLADAISRKNEPLTLGMLTRDHLVRDKKQPPSAGERRSLIDRAHKFGHFGGQALFMKLWNDGYWWKNIRKEISEVISECMPCQRYNTAKRGFHPLKAVSADLPWDHIAIDLVTPLPLSKNGEDTLLVTTDLFTKFTILRCLKGKGMTGIAQSIWEIMAILGVPKIIQSDNGTDFVNQLIEELVTLNGIDHRTISAYNPRANGAVERVNGVIENMLKKELQGAMNEWADYVPYVQLAYNAKVSSVTASTPFSLMFGRRLNDFEKYGRSNTKEKDSDLKLVLWKRRLEELGDVVYPAVKKRILDKKDQMIQAFGKKHRSIAEDAFPPGAMVMMIDKTRKSKWDPLYEGAFTVVRRNRGGAYVLKDKLGEILKRSFQPINSSL